METLMMLHRRLSLPSIHYLLHIFLVVTLMGPSMPTRAARFLIPEPPMYGMGHIQPLNAVSAALVQRGHHVTLLCATPECTTKFSKSNASEIIRFKSQATLESIYNYDKLVKGKYDFKASVADQFKFMKDIFITMASFCDDLFTDNNTVSYLENARFDMVLIDSFNPCDFLIAEHLHVPFTVLTGNRQYPHVNHVNFNFPKQLSYMPVALSHMTDQMNFFERVENCLRQYHNKFLVLGGSLKMDDAFYVLKDKFGISPNLDIMTIARKAEVWLAQEDASLDFPHPGMPNWVPVGGIGVRPAEPLPKVLEDFVNAAGPHGVVIFSPGSIIDSLPEEASYTSIIMDALAKLPHRVIWKHKGKRPKNVGDNILIMPWIPQNDLLGHPNTKLYIAHGGLNGIYEAIYHAVPMIVIPLMLDDQKENAVRVNAKGLGIYLRKEELTEEIFHDSLMSVLYDDKYSNNMNRASAILRDNRPMERAIFWIEHVVKFGGSHLRAESFRLNYIQNNLIDVYGFFLTVIASALFIIGLLVRLTCCLCWRNRNEVVEKQSKLD